MSPMVKDFNIVFWYKLDDINFTIIFGAIFLAACKGTLLRFSAKELYFHQHSDELPLFLGREAGKAP